MIGIALIAAGIIAGAVILTAGSTILADHAEKRWGDGFRSNLTLIMTVLAAILAMTAPIVFVVLNSHDDRPCARYEYTWIKGVRYRVCAEHWEPAP